ncbi:MAG: hypothetical protein VYE73_14895 [Acidobacteriota bacterium]|nr:hypothetical protein [Acidobacteriota bacterium]
MVSYVRSLSVGAQDVVVAGNARSGSILYRSKGECSGCHRVGGRGGLLGPDLSDVGWIRSPEHIETSLLRPGDVVDDSYRKVAVELKSGGEVVGLLRNESTYSIQMLDETGKLRSFEKSDLASLDKPSDSLMPAFDDLFSPGEIQDLVAYLYSLKGEQ